jgi:hypothetical protein
MPPRTLDDYRAELYHQHEGCIVYHDGRTCPVKQPRLPFGRKRRRTMTSKSIAVLAAALLGLAQLAAVEVPKQTGYCVTWNDEEGTLGVVTVPLHRPDAARLDELRGSVRNALALIQAQLLSKSVLESDPAKKERLSRASSELDLKLQAGVSFDGERPDPDRVRRRVEPPSVNCSCTTLYGDAVSPKYHCGGACGGCYFCR